MAQESIIAKAPPSMLQVVSMVKKSPFRAIDKEAHRDRGSDLSLGKYLC